MPSWRAAAPHGSPRRRATPAACSPSSRRMRRARAAARCWTSNSRPLALSLSKGRGSPRAASTSSARTGCVAGLSLLPPPPLVIHPQRLEVPDPPVLLLLFHLVHLTLARETG